MRLLLARAISSTRSMLRFMNAVIARSGPGHQLRYASVDLSDVSESGLPGSTSVTFSQPCPTESRYAAAMPATPPPQMTIFAFAMARSNLRDLRVLDDLAPLGDFGADIGAELGRRDPGRL